MLANVLVLGQLAIGIEDIATSGTFTGLPICSSQKAIDLAKRAIESSPMGKTVGLAIIDLSDIKEVSAIPNERRCTASAMLNNGSVQKAAYRLFIQDESTGQWFLKIDLQ